jgi:hypothetical protein
VKPEFPDLNRPPVLLPHQFDPDRLQYDVARLADAEWSNHAEKLPNVRVLPLVSVGGGTNNDLAISGPMRETSALLRSPYLREVLATFEHPVSRTQLWWVGPNAAVPSHRDSGYYWYRRLRIHVPVLTDPAVVFECGDRSARLRAGETWYFDNWQRHSLTNGSESPCIHLVIDIRASPDLHRPLEALDAGAQTRASHRHAPHVEPYCFEILTPPEFTNLTRHVRGGAPAHAEAKVEAALTAASASWREIFLRSGNNANAEAEYYLVIDRLRRELANVEFPHDAQRALNIVLTVLRTDDGIGRQGRREFAPRQPAATWSPEVKYRTRDGQASVPSSPRIAAVVKAFREPRTPAVAHETSAVSEASTCVMSREQFTTAARDLHRIGLLEQDLSETALTQPVFIVSAPRSGSTMLFDALKKSDDLWTTGHESHALIEHATGLHPEERQWLSNRLTGDDYTPRLRSLIAHRYAKELRNVQGVYLTGLTMAERRRPFRLLDKTPKNALRIPFLHRLFPDARFVYLYRDPAPNVSSMIEGWRCEQFVTYPHLPGWPYWPWSFLLPPEWPQLRGSPPAEIAGFQWSSANTHIVNDLTALPDCSWIAVSYENLVRNPRPLLQALFRFLNCSWGKAAEEYAARPLPLSPTTLGIPHPDKWLKHEHVIRPLLPALTAIRARAQELEGKTPFRFGGSNHSLRDLA